ncbi:MAG TPA: hypothetical protein VNG33_00405, partial [Polyangiaceae bacterium]|nr:hypothetical protein [Polyangiaceae bacterium]
MTMISLRPRAPVWRSRGGVVCFLILVSLAGCATTSGSTSSGGASAPTSDARGLSLASPAASDKQTSRELGGPVLERASFVRAVLRKNPSLESARQGFRA